jgi:hypothetical protein
MKQPFAPGDRTYYVSDDRLRAFKALTPEQRLRWVEELAGFLRLAKISKKRPVTKRT